MGQLVEMKGVCPAFLSVRQAVDFIEEAEYFVLPVVGALAGGKHVGTAPDIDPVVEFGQALVAVIGQVLGLDEDRIRKHVDVAVKVENLGFGIVGPVPAFDQLAVFVAHRAPALEDGDGVFGVVIQIAGAQGVEIFVLQLDHGAPELGQVVVDVVVQFLAAEYGFVLKDADMAESLYDVDVHVPIGRVTDQIGLVVKESRRTDDFAVVAVILLDELCGLRTHQAHQTVRRLLAVLGRQREHGRKKP